MDLDQEGRDEGCCRYAAGAHDRCRNGSRTGGSRRGEYGAEQGLGSGRRNGSRPGGSRREGRARRCQGRRRGRNGSRPGGSRQGGAIGDQSPQIQPPQWISTWRVETSNLPRQEPLTTRTPQWISTWRVETRRGSLRRPVSLGCRNGSRPGGSRRGRRRVISRQCSPCRNGSRPGGSRRAHPSEMSRSRARRRNGSRPGGSRRGTGRPRTAPTAHRPAAMDLDLEGRDERTRLTGSGHGRGRRNGSRPGGSRRGPTTPKETPA